jgi:hypothetical protein
MKCLQLSMVCNTATTGHKLQGSTEKNLFVHAWNYKTNWPYVVLSRVTTMVGLQFRKKLEKRFKSFQQPTKFKELMQKIKNKTSELFTDQQRADLFGWMEGDDFIRE